MSLVVLRDTAPDKDGYPRKLVERDGKLKSEYTHRLVMEEHLDRRLSSDELVHHRDGDKTNNSIENLMIVTRQEHGRLHIRSRRARRRASTPPFRGVEHPADQQKAQVVPEKKGGLGFLHSLRRDA